jgi:hypothetical protein
VEIRSKFTKPLLILEHRSLESSLMILAKKGLSSKWVFPLSGVGAQLKSNNRKSDQAAYEGKSVLGRAVPTRLDE